VVFGKASFNPETRRVLGVRSVDLVVADGKWAVYEGKAQVAAK
jgi:branched-chain amino acid transport system substrate-binding protein